MASEMGVLQNQQVSHSKKKNKDWYINNFRYYFNACSTDNHNNIDDYYDILLNGLSDKHFKHVLNPYNSQAEEYNRLPGVVRNIDIITPLWERYVGEYIAQYDNFVVSNVNPEAVEIREAKVTAKAIAMIGELLISKMQERMNQYKEQLKQNPDAEPDYESIQMKPDEISNFVEKARESWSRQQTITNKRKLKLINKLTHAQEIYIEGFFHWFVAGRVISYHDIRNDDIHKSIIHPQEFKRYGNSRYIEDDVGMLRQYRLTLEEIKDQLGDDLTPKVINLLSNEIEQYYTPQGIHIPIMKALDTFDLNKDDVIEDNDYILNTDNGILIEHLVWVSKTLYYEVSEDILGADQLLTLEQLIFTEEEYQKAKLIIPEENFTKVWQDEYWEQYRFGPKGMEVYSIPRPVKVQESDVKQSLGPKAPYNGLYGDIQGLNTSKFKRLINYQVAINFLYLDIERNIAKNQGRIIVIPEQLMGDTDQMSSDGRLYYMKADNKLLVDMSDLDYAEAQTYANMIKVLDAGLNNYIKDMIDLLEYTKKLAWDEVAMSEERYGNVNPNAGKAVTEQTLFRTALGSRLTFDMYNNFVARDFEKSLNYSKIAWPDGRTDAIIENGKVEFVTVGGEPGVLDDLGVSIKYSANERESVTAAKQGAFSIYQNDQPELATAVLAANSMDEITEIMTKFSAIKRKYDVEMAKAEKDASNANIEKEIEKINVDKEWDYKIASMKEEGETVRKKAELAVKLSDFNGGKVQLDDVSFKQSIDERKMKLAEDAQSDLNKYNDKLIGIKKEELKLKKSQKPNDKK